MTETDQTAHQLPEPVPPAVAALQRMPLLLQTVQASIHAQVALIQRTAPAFTGQRLPLTRLEVALQSQQSGVVRLEGTPGSGITTLLAHLASTRPMPFWFADADQGNGVAALAAQIIALYDLDVPLIPPATRINAHALEAVLVAAVQCKPDRPLIILIDLPTCPSQPLRSLPLLLPHTLPEGCMLVIGAQPTTELPFLPLEQITLPQRGSGSLRDQSQLLLRMGCTSADMMPLITAAQGNLLHLRLAYQMVQAGMLTSEQVRPELSALYAVWWQHLPVQEQRLALLLGAAGEPLPLALCQQVLQFDPQPTLSQWQQLGLVQLTTTHVSLDHWSLRSFIDTHAPDALAAMHATLARTALHVFERDGSLGSSPTNTPSAASSSLNPVGHYLARQFSRHAALSHPPQRAALLPYVTQRAWVRAQERRTSSLLDAAHDAAWELRDAAHAGDVVRLVRAATLTGSLIALSQTMPPDAATHALHIAVERLGRETGLRRVQTLIEQLPDTHPKALVLRQVGEACYTLRMRTSAMRLLSQALDIEELKFPATWHEQRDTLHTELARTALQHTDVGVALQIARRIAHVERRGALETEIMRWLLQHEQYAAAQQLADQIEHTSMQAWAQSEVVVRLARMGVTDDPDALLSTVALETARSWAVIELACDLAAHDEEAAIARIEQLPTPTQQDRGRAQLAQALADADKDGDALAVAGRIQDVAVRVSALLDLRLRLEGLVAMLALEQATSVINRLPREVRVPLVAMLAAAYAALGNRAKAYEVAQQLPTGEEQDRALSRVAVALAQRGDLADGIAAAQALADLDERDWTLDELTHLLAERQEWAQAHAIAMQISAARERDRALADLAIARARSDAPLEAMESLAAIIVPDEYIRAITMAAPALVASGNTAAAQSLLDSDHHTLTLQQRSRVLAVIAAALIEHGRPDDLAQARSLISTMSEPLDQARTHLALARYAAASDPQTAFAELGASMQVALYGRDDLFRVLPSAAPIFALLGGPALLDTLSAAIEEIDHWS